MTIENLTSKESTGPTGIIDKAIELAQSGDPSGVLSPAFTEALKTVRKQDESYYLLQIKPRIKELKTQPPVSIGDIEKLTKPPKQAKQRYSPNQDEDSDDKPRQGKTELFIDMVSQWAKVFCDESGNPYATFPVQPFNTETGELLPIREETWPLGSDQFNGKATLEFRKQFGLVPGESAIKEACVVLAAEAEDRPREPVYLRYAPMSGNEPGVYIDLANTERQVVEITRGGWRVVGSSECAVNFKRTKQARPLPLPERGGDLGALWDNVNIPDANDRLLVLAWLLDCMRVNTEYPILELTGGQGTAKSTTQKRLRELIDPNEVLLRTKPRSTDNLSVSCDHSHVISLNNLSKIDSDMSDHMCSMSTGGGDATRKLHTTGEEVVFDISRPLIINGISQLVTRPDLAERTIGIELPKIKRRKTGTELTEQWEKDYPLILGALYQLMAESLRDLHLAAPDKLPRLGDYGLLGAAMCLALKNGVDFCHIAQRKFNEAIARGVESSPAIQALIELINQDKLFEGTAGELLAQLDRDSIRPRYFDRQAWPKSAKGLSNIIRQLAPSLQVYGISVEWYATRSNKTDYLIQKIDKQTDIPTA